MIEKEKKRGEKERGREKKEREKRREITFQVEKKVPKQDSNPQPSALHSPCQYSLRI